MGGRRQGEPERFPPHGRGLAALETWGRRVWWVLLAGLLAAACGVGLWAAGSFWRGSRQETAATSPPALPNAERPPRPFSPTPGTPPAAPPPAPPPRAAQPLREEALQLAGRLLDEFPASADALYLRGLLLNRYGENEEALRCWEHCTRLAPGFAPAYEHLGLDALKRGQYTQAVSLLGKALELDPKLPDAGLRLAESLMGLGRAEEAASALERHLAAWPDSVEGQFRLGQAFLQLHRYPQAWEHHQAAVKLDPNCTLAYYGLAQACAELGEADKAREYREQFQKLKQKDMLSQKTQRREHDDDAMLRRTLGAAYLAAGKIYAGRGDAAKAEACWRRASVADPGSPQSRFALAAMLAEGPRVGEALEILEELRKAEPDNADYCLSVGALSARLKRWDAAEAAFRQAMRVAARRGEACAGLAEMYLVARRNLPEAKTLAETAVQLRPTAENHFLYSAACLGNGDLPGARAALQKALERDPGNPKYREALSFLEQRGK